MKLSKRHKANIENYKKDTYYDIKEAISLIKSFSTVKFDESIDIAVNLGVDPKHADQLVRGTVSLPNGTGKNIRVIVLTKDDEKISEAKKSGAEDAGFDELFNKIKGGWIDFDAMIATPDVMPEVGKLGQILGPRGLMPNPKTGTVTNEVSKAVLEIKAGKVEFRVDKFGVIHVAIGKLSFDEDKIYQNVKACMDAIVKAKPASLKGTYLKKFVLSTTMGPGIKINNSHFIK